MAPAQERRGLLARALGGAGAAAACVPMVAMLPAGASSALSLVGLGAGSGAVAALSPALSPIAKPLLLAATAMVAVSHLRCSRLAVASTVAGGALLYLGMYTITQADGRAEAWLFYPGLALFIASYLIPIIRRRLRRCRPVVTPRLANTLLLTTLLASTIAVGSAAAFQNAPARAHAPTTGHHAPAGGAMPGMSMGH